MLTNGDDRAGREGGRQGSKHNTSRAFVCFFSLKLFFKFTDIYYIYIYFASIIVFAVEELFGVSPTQDHSDLADMDKAGRWKGFKV